MKTKLFLFAVAAAALASCSNDETVAVNQSDAITFRPLVNSATRATDITADNLASFYVTANNSGASTTAVFGETTPMEFAKNGTTYTSTPPQYWPESGNLDFIAFAPATGTGTGITRTDSTQFSVTPNSDPASQQDFVYAVVRNQNKANNSSGIALNFRHAESKVVIQLKNTSPDFKFTVKDVALCYIKPTGAFHPIFKTSSGSEVGFCTDGTNVSNTTSDANYYIAPGAWTTSGTETSYTQTATKTEYAINTTTAVALPAAMILIPQTLTAANQYSAATSSSAFNGASISVELKIQDSSDQYLAGDAENYVTAIFPLTALQWLPGHQYTYTVDLANGGYYETNHDENIDLDPILNSVAIKFTNVSVDTWKDGTTN